MRNRIKNIIKDIIDREGGYVNHPNDRGGPTKYGITLATFESWLGRQCSADDVKAISKETAAEIYMSDYFFKPGIHKLPVQLHDFMLDASVHHGPHNAVKKVLQETMLRNGTNTGGIDGIIGPKTIAATIKSMDYHGSQFIAQLIKTRIDYVERIAERDKSQHVFLAGWKNRIEALMPEGLA